MRQTKLTGEVAPQDPRGGGIPQGCGHFVNSPHYWSRLFGLLSTLFASISRDAWPAEIDCAPHPNWMFSRYTAVFVPFLLATRNSRVEHPAGALLNTRNCHAGKSSATHCDFVTSHALKKKLGPVAFHCPEKLFCNLRTAWLRSLSEAGWLKMWCTCGPELEITD